MVVNLTGASRRRLVERHEPGDRLAVVGDDDLFVLLEQALDTRKLGAEIPDGGGGHV